MTVRMPVPQKLVKEEWKPHTKTIFILGMAIEKLDQADHCTQSIVLITQSSFSGER